MAETLATESIPLVTSADGVVRVRGTRITLDSVVAAFTEGATAEEIAREEKKRARDQKLKEAEMMKLYREHVLGEKPQTDVVPLTSIAPAPKPAEKQEPVGSFGD